MSKKPEQPASKNLSDAELEKVSGGGNLLGDDIGQPAKKDGDQANGVSGTTLGSGRIRK